VPFPFLALAIAGTAISGAQAGAGIAGGIFAKKKADKAKRLRKRLLARSVVEESFQLEKTIEQILGAQRAGFAAAGVEVGKGTARAVRAETQESARRARESLAFSYVYERKGAGTAGPGVASYFGGLASVASSASALGSAISSRPRPGTTSPSRGSPALAPTRGG